MQKSIADLITSVTKVYNLPTPATVITSQDANVQQLLAFAREVNADLLAEFGWETLQTEYSFTTVDGQDEYEFPADIDRWINGTFFDQTNRWEMLGPLSPRNWEWLKVWNVAGTPFQRFRVFGGKIHLYPTPGPTPITFVCEYISNSAVLDGSTGLPKADYTQDSDVCRFDSRVVVYGIKLKWAIAKGLDTTAALTDYRRALEQAKGSDAPAPRLSLLRGCGNGWMISNANIPDGNWGQ